MQSLPHIEHEHPIAINERLLTFPDSMETTNIHSYVDSNLGNDKAHRQSVTGMAHMLAGGVIAYKSKYQEQ